MPEAPEVQTVLNRLEEEIKGRTITGVKITHPKLSASMSVQEMEKALTGQRFESFDRHGKYLVFHMRDKDWISHLRMEGKFLLLDALPEEEKERKHIHAVFSLDDGRLLCYRDTRKFGRMYVYDKKPDWQKYPCFSKVGKDYKDPQLTGALLQKLVRKRKCPLKSALLDQSLIAGIGNIYADEILFAARENPFRPANELSADQWDVILQKAREIMQRSERHGGTTIRTFSSDGHPGEFQNQLQVHNRKGEPCPVCGTPIELAQIGQRSTYYCPACQNAPVLTETEEDQQAGDPQ